MISKLIGSAGFLSSGGTIGGDLTISGDLTVSGGGSLTYDESVTGLLQVTSPTSGGSPQIILTRTDNGDGNGIKLITGSTDDWIIGERNDSTSDFRIYSYGAGFNALNILRASGYVGIGVSTPTYPLHVAIAGSGQAYAQFTNSSTGHDANSGLNVGMNGNDAYIWSRESGSMFFGIVDTKMKLDANSRISLSNNDGNTSNTVFGKNAFVDDSQAVLGNVGADFNVVIGEDAMGAGDTTTAIHNTAVGYKACEEIVDGIGNCAFGDRALSDVTDGSMNVAIGAHNGGSLLSALHQSRVGSFNIAIGTGTLGNIQNTSNDGSIAIGHLACAAQVVTSGAQFAGVSIGIGYKALTSLTTGTVNLAIGHEALQHCVEGEANLAIGHGALGDWDADTTVDASSHNVMIGLNAGGGAWETAVSNYNVGVGNYVMDAVMNGATSNTALGHNALSDLTTGDYNVALGSGAGQAITTDNNVVAIGYGAYNAMDTATDA